MIITTSRRFLPGATGTAAAADPASSLDVPNLAVARHSTKAASKYFILGG
jgi:hypothetical protein